MKLGLRIGLILVIVLIVFVCVAAVTVLGPRAFLGPRLRPLTSRTFDITSARLERGRYLANSMGCLYCHSPHDWSQGEDPILPGMTGAGQQLPYTDLPGRVFAPNLTPDKETGIGSWTDDMLARAIREGISYDGRALFGIMPFAHYRNMPDEDLASVVVYLRSLEPIRNSVPRTEIIFPVKYIMRNDPQPLTDAVPAPDLSDPVKRGRFLVNLIGCGDCHHALPLGWEHAWCGQPEQEVATIYARSPLARDQTAGRIFCCTTVPCAAPPELTPLQE